MSALLAVAILLAAPGSAEPPLSKAAQQAAKRHGHRITPAFIAELDGLAKAGDASAAQALGELHQIGGNANDSKKACDYFELAAPERADALHNLATCHFRGDGRPADMAKARSLYEQASRRGSVRAHCALGNMLVAGRGGPSEPARGVELCRIAAVAGDADAQTDYGGHLLGGVAGTRDTAEARKWLTAAAGKGHANAALLLGKMHWNGDGTAKNNSEAARWWRQAYRAGRPAAALLLGQAALVRLTAAGSPQDADPAILEEALNWLSIAAEKDPDPAARERASALLAQLRPLRGQLGKRK